MVRLGRVPTCRAPLRQWCGQFSEGEGPYRELTASIANLDASLTNMQGDDFAHGGAKQDDSK